MDTKKGQLDYGKPKKKTLSSYIKVLERALEDPRINEAKAYNRKQPIDLQYIKALEYQATQGLILHGKKYPELLADPVPHILQDILIRFKKVKDTKSKKAPEQEGIIEREIKALKGKKKRGRPIKYTDQQKKDIYERAEFLESQGISKNEIWYKISQEYNCTENAAKAHFYRYKNQNIKHKQLCSFCAIQ